MPAPGCCAPTVHWGVAGPQGPPVLRAELCCLTATRQDKGRGASPPPAVARGRLSFVPTLGVESYFFYETKVIVLVTFKCLHHNKKSATLCGFK